MNYLHVSRRKCTIAYTMLSIFIPTTLFQEYFTKIQKLKKQDIKKGRKERNVKANI